MHNTASDLRGLLIQRTSGHFFLFAAGASWPGEVNITDNVMHSIAIVQSTTSRGFYVDGVLKDSSNNAPANGFGTNITIGAARVSSVSVKMPGEYCNFAVYTTALSDANRNLVEAWALG